jgi:flagellar FliJ protein
MNKFVFKLEPLYEYRQRLEEICMREFGEAVKRLDDEETRLSMLHEGYLRSSEEMDKLKEDGGQAEDLNMYYAYFLGLKKHISEQERIIRQVREVFESKQGSLAVATKERKVVETIKDRSFDAYVQRLEKEEQKTTDDIVSSRFKRSGRDEV